MTNEQLERIEYLRTKSEETELTPIEKREFSELALKSAEEALEQAKKSLKDAQKAVRLSIVCAIAQIALFLIVLICKMTL